MNRLFEAELMIRDGITLVCWVGDRITAGPDGDGGYVVTGYRGGQPDIRKNFESARRAIRFFRVVVQREGLLQALDANRYDWMFPIGSSLDWREPEDAQPAAAARAAS